MTLACDLCSATVDTTSDPGTALTWATSVEAGVTRHLCTACTRAQVRDIEAKLELGVG